MSSIIEKIKNTFIPSYNPFQQTTGGKARSSDALVRTGGGSDNPKHNANNLIFPSAPDRTAKDVGSWREALQQAESPFFPYRTAMQMLYNDTILNEQVRACMLRRRNLTMLRDFVVKAPDGTELKEWTEYFKRPWFSQKVLSYIIDAKFYGYSLIALGDIKDGIFVNPSIVRRPSVSPDRMQVMPFYNNPSGYYFNEAPYKDWHLWVPTISEDGVSTCGYGILYPIAKTEIYLRGGMAMYADFVAIYGQPIRELKTSKTEESERQEALRGLEDMGSNPVVVTDPMTDELIIHSAGNSGNGYKSYNDFIRTLNQTISKVLLGHEDAISSVPGKLGASELVTSGSKTNDGDASTPVAKALRDIQSEDANFIEPYIRYELIPKMLKLGINKYHGEKLMEGAYLEFLNDAEDRVIKAMEADKNQKIATLALTMVQGGMKMDETYFTDQTGVPCTAIPIGDVANNQLGSVNDKSEHLKTGEALKDKNMERTNSPKKIVNKLSKKIEDGITNK